MSRRKLVAIVAAVLLLGITLGVVALIIATQTRPGQDQIRSFIQDRLSQAATGGSVHLGAIHGSLLADVTIDSVEIRGADDSLLFASGPISVDYDPRDIVDKRLLLRNLRVERPIIHLTQYNDESWNINRIFAPKAAPAGPRLPNPLPGSSAARERGFGDFISVDTLELVDATLVLRQPWRPDPAYKGTARDSVIRWHLARTDAEFRRVEDGYARYRRWNKLTLTMPQARIADPDSAGMSFLLSEVTTVMTDPPLDIRHLDGTARIIGDSLWLQVPHLVLPASRGRANGKVVWGQHLPARWNVHIDGDTVALADIDWVYPTLPTTGGGHSGIDIKSDPRDPTITDYVLTDMDVLSTKSRISGNMTFRTGGPLLNVKDVSLRSAPLDFALIQVLAGGQPFPAPWAGQFTGTVRGRGGPVDHFQIDALAFTFRDANVRGATTEATGVGELDITEPSLAVFHGFALDVAHLDLRTPRFLFSDFPLLGGQTSGHVVLDSIWTDVRFRDATIVHTDTAGPPSTFTGSGRITMGDTLNTYDATLQAQPVSFTTFALSYPALPFRGNYSGPIRVQGTTDALSVTTSLSGVGGELQYTGTIDSHEPVYGVNGTGSVRGVNLPVLFGRPELVQTRLDGTYRIALRGDTLRKAVGALDLSLGASMVDSIAVFPSHALLTFDNGLLRVDTMRVVTAAATATATGAIGIADPRRDSVTVSIRVDSLAGLKRYIDPYLATDPDVLAADTLRGSGTLQLALTGSLDSLGLSGNIGARRVGVGTVHVDSLKGDFNVANVLDHPAGWLNLQTDSMRVGTWRLDSVRTAFTMSDPNPTQIAFAAKTPDDASIAVRATMTTLGDTTITMVDTLSVDVDRSAWRLEAPVRIESSLSRLRVSELRMVRRGGGRIALSADLPDQGNIAFRMTGDSVPLEEMGRLAQMTSPLGGLATVSMSATGSRRAPEWQGSGLLVKPRSGGIELDTVRASFQYANLRLTTMASLVRSGQGARLTASLPLNLAFVPVARRKIDAPLSGTLQADNADLRLLESFTSVVKSPSGRMSANLSWGGTWGEPIFDGSLRVSDGALILTQAGIAVENLNADLQIVHDTIQVRRFSVQSGPSRGDTLWVGGTVAINDLAAPIPNLSIRARNFKALNLPRVADATINASLFLTPYRGESILSGTLQLTQGSLYIPELANKRLADVEDLMPEASRQRPVLPKVLATMSVSGVNVELLNDVWLRSAQRNVNVQLSGAVSLSTVTEPTLRAPFGVPVSVDSVRRLALEGRLAADRGRYTWDLGIVRRDFQVQSGFIEFNGGADLQEASLDITALFVVRQPAGQDNRRDLPIQVHLTGTLANPEVSVAAADANLALSQADLLSYLAFGAPFYDIGAAGAAQLQTAASILLPSLASSFSDRFGGGALDLVQLEAARIDTIAASGVRDVLGNTRLALGKQLGPRTFVSANTSFCKLGGLFNSTEDLIQSLGIKVEQRLGHDYSAAFAVEPGTAGATCRDVNASSRALISTPRQLGLDLFKIWRF